MKIFPRIQIVQLPHINTSDPSDETQVQVVVTLTFLSSSQRLINRGSYNLYRFPIHTIDRNYKTVPQIRR